MIERYSVPEMEEIWSRDSRFARWLEIELLATEARVLSGDVPLEDLESIRAGARFDAARIDEIEARVRHDVIAFLTCVSEGLGPESRHLHYGMTSSDVLDTCLATQIRDSGRLLVDALEKLLDSLRDLCLRTRGLVCMGRTHGMYAEPTTYALKFAGFHSECARALDALRSAVEQASFGKLSGAVGTFAHIPPGVEEHVCSKLGIGAEPVATQVVPRDRIAGFLWALCRAGNMLERFAQEIRHLQRSEVGEVMEAFRAGQKGSSAMPHKRNPIVSERLCGMARLLRGYLLVGLENTALWHERDISHSAAERFILPDACGVALYSIRKAEELARGLTINGRAVARNLEEAGDSYYTQTLLLALIDGGMSREEAYGIVQSLALAEDEAGDVSFVDRAAADPAIRKTLGEDRVRELCRLERLVSREDSILERAGVLDQA
ncbi:adenylosuccinate lyase [Candidatus Fermentibacterales bacterium]|nr:adenylosuccinate lyase [Candidatus Fermentibacterales bacterium]